MPTDGQERGSGALVEVFAHAALARGGGAGVAPRIDHGNPESRVDVGGDRYGERADRRAPADRDGRQASVCAEVAAMTFSGTHSDHNLVVFLEAVGVNSPDNILDDPDWVEWRGGRAY
jgi:hypothetical protein